MPPLRKVLATNTDESPLANLGAYGACKAVAVLLVTTVAAVLQPDAAATVISLIFGFGLAAFTGYQTYAVRLGLMRSEWSWVMRRYRREAAQV